METRGSQPDWQLEREFFDRELRSFVPDKVFDAHAHLFRASHLGGDGVLAPPQGIPREAGHEEYRRLIDILHPGRGRGALYIPAPFVIGQRDDANRWVSEQRSKDPHGRGLFFALPGDDPDWVSDQVRDLGLQGLKVYHTAASYEPNWDAPIPEFFPEPLAQMAHKQQWFVVLHLTRLRGLADASNLRWIEYYCRSYPGMKLCLAHAARGYQPAHNLEGLPKLTGLANLFFDGSFNCEPLAQEAILRLMGPEKLLYGSDFYASHIRGRTVSAGDSCLWIGEEHPIWKEQASMVKPVFAGLESLRALKLACWSARLSDAQIEGIFFDNAARLFAL